MRRSSKQLLHRLASLHAQRLFARIPASNDTAELGAHRDGDGLRYVPFQ